MLLLLSPVVIAILRYSMTYYVLLDNPDCSVKEAMQESAELIYGHKWQLLCYQGLLGLIAFLVAIPTLCIGLLWIIPWISVFHAAFYESLRNKPFRGRY